MHGKWLLKKQASRGEKVAAQKKEVYRGEMVEVADF